MAKKVLSEQNILEAARRGDTRISFDENTIITDAARDRAKQLGIKLEVKDTKQSVPSVPPTGVSNSKSGEKELIALGSDHGGFQLKELLISFLQQAGYKIVDLGTYNEEACDYPDFAYAVARMVSLGEASKGIMIDSVGIASAMVANKVPNVRAACCYDEFSARSSREHNDANVLTLGGKVMGVELAKAITQIWLTTWFGGGRHQKRVNKISEVEKRFLK